MNQEGSPLIKHISIYHQVYSTILSKKKKKKLHCVLINPCRFGPKVKEIFSRFTFRTQRKLHLTRCSGRPRSWDWVSNPITCVTSLVIHLIFSIPLQKTPTGLHSRSREHFCFSLFFLFFFFLPLIFEESVKKCTSSSWLHFQTIQQESWLAGALLPVKTEASTCCRWW